jgi:PAS domain S-box-containing protein
MIPFFESDPDGVSRLTADERLHLVSQAIEANVTPLAFADSAGRLTFVNRSFLDLWGYDRAAAVGGRPLSSFIDCGCLQNGSRKAGCETVATAGNGRRRFSVSVAITRVIDGGGAPAGFMIAFSDMTDRATAERALMESEERYRSLVETARDPIFTANAEGRFLYVNGAAARMLGSTPADVIGRTVEDLFPSDAAERYRHSVSHVVATGEILTTEDLTEVDNHLRWFSTVVQPVRDPDGRIVAAQAIVRDITTRKQAEETLRRSEERLNQAISVANLGIFDHDHITEERYWSPEIRRIVGWPLEAPVPPAPSDGDSHELQQLIHPDDRRRVWDAVVRSQAPHSDGFFDVEYRVYRTDGELRWVRVRSQTFFQGDGEVRQKVRTVGAMQDITERKTADTERERLTSQLTQAQKMESIGRLAGGVAHDFNNMLSVISGHVELALRAASHEDPLRDDLQQIKDAAARATDLTRQLLGFARRQTVAPRVLDLNVAVGGSLLMLRRLIGEDIDLVWHPGAGLRRVRVDPMQVDQILTNLVANARDAIAGVGRLTIHTENVELRSDPSRRADVSPGTYVKLEVTDTGEGMDPSAVAHLFEPFFTTKPVGQGTGLGLATVYGIVRQNDGCVEVRSERHRGTTVRVFLPSVEAEVATAGGDNQPGARSGSETVLLVEDEAAVLRLSKAVLERFGYRVLTATTPAEAIEVFGARGGQVQLLVTDVVMPEMNGRELATRLRATRPDLKTLFVSGYSASALAPRGVLDPGVHFLQKPFTIEGFATSVREALDSAPPGE